MDEKEKIEDAEIVRAFNGGDESAFDELVNRHSLKMFQAAYGLLGNREDAEEVVQDAFIKAHKNLRKFRGDSSFSTWLYRIVINLSKNKYYWNKRRGSDLNISLSRKNSDSIRNSEKKEMDLRDAAPDPELMMQKAENEMKIMEAIDKLPKKLREAIVLRHVEDLRYEKMAELLDCNVGTVKSRLSRARESLGKI